MKKLLRASCLALAVWLATVPALADIIIDPRPRPRPPQEPNMLVAVLVLGVVAIAAALLVRTVLRMRKP